MRHWKLPEIETTDGTRSPVVLHSTDSVRRIVLIGLKPGEALGDHRVKESALVLVLDGTVRVEAGPGELFEFDPDEKHSVLSAGGARVLLLLAPWPGEGHYRGDQPAASGVSAS